MPDQSPDAIAEAARHCLTRISAGDAPLGILAECLGELRDQGWNQQSLNAVDFAVRQVLKGMVVRDEGPTFF